MSEVAELVTRVRLSDPKPGHCAGCFCSSGPDVKFVDFQAAVDRGAFVDADGAMGVLDSIDELHLCEACVRQAAEVLEFVPGLHRRHLGEIRRLNAELERANAHNANLEAALSTRAA